MRFAVGDVLVDIITDDDDFELPLGPFLPESDRRQLMQHRSVLEPDFLDFESTLTKAPLRRSSPCASHPSSSFARDDRDAVVAREIGIGRVELRIIVVGA